MRPCGGCTLCCFFMRVPDMNSREYSYCIECTPNKGCNIWHKRPPVCSGTNCVWVVEEQIPDSFRPDRVGFMFERPVSCDVYIGHIDPERSWVWNSVALSVFVNKINQAGYSVVLCTAKQGENFYSLAEGDTIERVKKTIQNSFNYYIQQGLA